LPRPPPPAPLLPTRQLPPLRGIAASASGDRRSGLTRHARLRPLRLSQPRRRARQPPRAPLSALAPPRSGLSHAARARSGGARLLGSATRPQPRYTWPRRTPVRSAARPPLPPRLLPYSCLPGAWLLQCSALAAVPLGRVGTCCKSARPRLLGFLFLLRGLPRAPLRRGSLRTRPDGHFPSACQPPRARLTRRNAHQGCRRGHSLHNCSRTPHLPLFHLPPQSTTSLLHSSSLVGSSSLCRTIRHSLLHSLMTSPPFDGLTVRVLLNDGQLVLGILVAFDPAMSPVLRDCVEIHPTADRHVSGPLVFPRTMIASLAIEPPLSPSPPSNHASAPPLALSSHTAAFPRSPSPVDWVVDSGASFHTTPTTSSLLHSHPPHPSHPSSIVVGNGSTLPITSSLALHSPHHTSLISCTYYYHHITCSCYYHHLLRHLAPSPRTAWT
jgi:small nuclear ribonucleoprotein (snRNP)-like protein